MQILVWMLIGSGLMLAGISLPLILRAIPPNFWYGFRVRRTLEDPHLWYEVNAYAGARLLVAGLVIAVTAALFCLVPGITLDTYALACLGMSILSLSLAIGQSMRFLRQLDK